MIGTMNLPSEKIFVAGHRGMVGSAIVRILKEKGCEHVITRAHEQLDLLDQKAVSDFFQSTQIDRVVLAAAKVGGIHANNTYPAEFIYNNLMIQNNVIHQAYLTGVKELLFLGSSCIYPKYARQPMQEESLLTDLLEPTNEPYAIAKIAGIKMCESYNRQYGTRYRSVMPTNLFGPGDNYHLENSHVIPAMIRKYHLGKLALQGKLDNIVADENLYGQIPDDIQAAIGYSSKLKTLDPTIQPKVVLWGTGSPRREFLHVDDMATACVHVMSLNESDFAAKSESFLNVGTGIDITIGDTAKLIARITGFQGETIFDSKQPDGSPRKLLDTTKINSLGWFPKFNLEDGLKNAYQDYMSGPLY